VACFPAGSSSERAILRNLVGIAAQVVRCPAVERATHECCALAGTTATTGMVIDVEGPVGGYTINYVQGLGWTEIGFVDTV